MVWYQVKSQLSSVENRISLGFLCLTGEKKKEQKNGLGAKSFLLSLQLPAFICFRASFYLLPISPLHSNCTPTEHYLSSKASSNERGPAGSASSAAHGVPHGFIQLLLRKDPMKRSLERTGQTCT